MSGSLLPVTQQWFDNNGNPLAAGKIWTYAVGTNTPKATYSDFALSTLNTNPVNLDSSGRATIYGAGGYKIIVTNKNDLVITTRDNIMLSGTGSTVDGDFTVTNSDTSFSDGRFTIDTSGYVPTPTDPHAFYTVNSNVYTNGDTYGSGGWFFNRPGVDNNQPSVFVRNNVSTTSLGNNAWLNCENLASASNNVNYDPAVATGGSIELLSVNRQVGALYTFDIDNYGSGYVDGTYLTAAVTATSGQGLHAYLNVTVTGGVVTAATMDMIGSYVGQGGGALFSAGDTFTIANTQLGGTGSGFSATVTGIVAYNGKLKFGIVSGVSDSTNVAADGYHYMGSRRSALSPSGVNSGFETNVRFYGMSKIGKGLVEIRGNELKLTPIYDFGSETNFTISSAYQSSAIDLISTKSDGDAVVTLASGTAGDARLVLSGGTGTGTRIEVESAGATPYIRVRTTGSGDSAANIIQADSGKCYIDLRANWVTPGTNTPYINLYTDNTAGNPTGFRIQTSGTNGRYNVKYINAGAQVETFDISPADDGLVILYQHSDNQKGRIKLGSGAGAAGGGVIAYDSATGIYALSGTNTKITVSGLTVPRRLTSAPANTAAAGEVGDYHVNASYLYFYVNGTGWVRAAVATF